MKVIRRFKELLDYAMWKGDFLDFAAGMMFLCMSLFGFSFTILIITGVIKWWL